ncbi:MAG: flagellar FliL protein [Halioglobus sp.]|jgi:flagellar FliL protein
MSNQLVVKHEIKERAGMKKIIIIVVALVVLGGGGAAAYFMLQEERPAVGADGEPVVEPVAEEEEKDAIYLSLDPAFVVNFERDGSIRYLQMSLQVMSYDQEVVDKVSANMPAVRNNLIMLFSAADYDSLASVEGKEALREQVLVSINELVRLKGDTKVDDVFFTGFVMQ